MTSIYEDRLANLKADRVTRVKLGLSTDGIDKSIVRFETLIADLTDPNPTQRMIDIRTGLSE